jgi:LexA-binding, inner membrane-associated putative hydrolase
MSWAAHDLEPYAFQRHLKLKIAFVPLLLGSYAPDLMTKWFVYGITIFGIELKADDPVQFHRGWPGFGFTHSLIFGLAVGLVFWKVFGSKIWGISFVIGDWAHSLTDTGDTVGTMLLFPWTHHFNVGAWAYAGQTGRMTDAAAYFSGPGAMWDLVWILYGFFAWRVLTTEYFDKYVFPVDSTWRWANQVIPRVALITLFRAAFFYGTCRWIAWTIWAHVIHHYPYDLSWGGPHWVDAAVP